MADIVVAREGTGRTERSLRDAIVDACHRSARYTGWVLDGSEIEGSKLVVSFHRKLTNGQYQVKDLKFALAGRG